MSLFLSILVYFATFSSSILFFKFAQYKNNTSFQIIKYIVAILIPCVTASFRVSGADFNTYMGYYDTIKEIGFASGREPFWVILNLLSPSRRWMLFLSAFMFLFFSYKSICYFVKKSRTSAWSIVLLVFYSTFLNIMRQMIAVSIIVYSFKYLFKRKYFNYLLWLIIGAMFHKSSFLLIIAPIIIFVSHRLKHYDILILVLTLIMPLLVPFIFTILSFFNLFSKYTQSLKFSFEPQFILCMLPPVGLYYLTGGKKSHSNIVNNLFCLYIISFPIQTMGFMASYIDRLTYNFYFTVCLLVPMIIDEIRYSNTRRQLAILSNGWFLIYYIGVFVVAGTATVYPYINLELWRKFYGK